MTVVNSVALAAPSIHPRSSTHYWSTELFPTYLPVSTSTITRTSGVTSARTAANVCTASELCPTSGATRCAVRLTELSTGFGFRDANGATAASPGRTVTESSIAVGQTERASSAGCVEQVKLTRNMRNFLLTVYCSLLNFSAVFFNQPVTCIDQSV